MREFGIIGEVGTMSEFATTREFGSA